MSRNRQQLAFGMILVVSGVAFSSISCGTSNEREPFNEPLDNDPIGSLLELQGEGLQVVLAGEVDYALDFGKVAVGHKFKLGVVAVNNGPDPLRVDVEEFAAFPSWLYVSLGRLDLGPYGTQRFEFSVDPREAGALEAVVALSTDEEERGIRQVRLHGEAIAVNLECEPLIDIGEVGPGEEGEASATCTNLGDVPITVSLGAIIGAYQRYFTAELQADEVLEAQLPAGEFIGILIRFSNPTNVGAATVTLPILDPRGMSIANILVQAHGL